MDDKRALFNQQMNEWVSRQGIWFQLRHAADGQSAFSRLAQLGLKLLLLCFVGALILWVYLVKRVEKQGFKDSVLEGVESTLKGKDCEVGAIRKDRGVGLISQIAMAGTDASFFHQLEAHRITLNMDLTSGLFGVWKGGEISINRLDVYLKAGASDDSEAAALYQSIFVKHDAFEFDRLNVERANVSWGYSSNNKGFIRDSHMIASREGDGWRLEFSGGTFNQNWLRRLEIEKLVVLCNQQGVKVQEGVLRVGEGRISFQLQMGEGGQPQVAGDVIFDSVPLRRILEGQYSNWLEGSISGKGTISGSPNGQEGIVMDLDLSLQEGDEILMRDTLPLLSALSVIDVYNSYRKILFTEGGCHIHTGGGRLKVDHINLEAGDFVHLAGSIDVRPPTHAEIAQTLGIEDVKMVTDVIDKNWNREASVFDAKESDLTLSKAAKGVGEVKNIQEADGNVFAGNAFDSSILNEKDTKRFEGTVKIGLRKGAFDAAPDLKKAYPFDAETGRIWMDVPLSGSLKALTLDQAKKLYILGRSRK